MRTGWICRGCSREGIVVMVMGDGVDDDHEGRRKKREEDTVFAVPERLRASQRRRTR